MLVSVFNMNRVKACGIGHEALLRSVVLPRSENNSLPQNVGKQGIGDNLAEDAKTLGSLKDHHQVNIGRSKNRQLGPRPVRSRIQTSFRVEWIMPHILEGLEDLSPLFAVRTADRRNLGTEHSNRERPVSMTVIPADTGGCLGCRLLKRLARLTHDSMPREATKRRPRSVM